MQSLRTTATKPATTSGNAEHQLNTLPKQLAAAGHIPFAEAYVHTLMVHGGVRAEATQLTYLPNITK